MIFKKIATIKSEKPAIKRLMVEAICDNDISYHDLEKIVREMKKKFNGDADCKISSIGGNVCVVMAKGTKPEKTLFEKMI